MLYISGEESEAQIKMRAERIGIENENCFVLTETNLEQIIHQFNEVGPDILIIDSIQTLHTNLLESSPGTVSQVRECASGLIKLAKESQVPVFSGWSYYQRWGYCWSQNTGAYGGYRSSLRRRSSSYLSNGYVP